MSIESWEAEFYPEEAEIAAKRGELAALDHSILKWTGLLPWNLKKHRLAKGEDDICIFDFDGDAFYIAGESCALCACSITALGLHDCDSCRLARFLGKACDKCSDSPYIVWLDTGDARPMLEALKGAKKMLLEEQAKGETK